MARIDLADRLAGTRSRLDDQPTPTVPAVPLFARLVRKETRVREDQYTALTGLARSLMRARRVKAERITENTLIRVAIDLLLTHQHHLRGATEDDLRTSITHSVTPALTDSAPPRLPNSATSDLEARGGAGGACMTFQKGQDDG